MKDKKKLKITGNLLYLLVFIVVSVAGIGYKLYITGKGSDISFIDAEVSDDHSGTVIVHEEETGQDLAGDGNDDDGREISVYICGCVNTPGVYELSSGSLLYDAVELAGGFNEEAAGEYVDLVMILDSNKTIYIPSKEDMADITNPFMCISDDKMPASDQTSGQQDKPVDINKASKDELTSLPGIGAATADAIIKYREEHPFSDIEDIMNVPGIGDAKYQKIKEMITV